MAADHESHTAVLPWSLKCGTRMPRLQRVVESPQGKPPRLGLQKQQREQSELRISSQCQ
jgi:hypothetical protein